MTDIKKLVNSLAVDVEDLQLQDVGLYDLMRIDDHNLNDAFANQAALYAYFGMRTAQLEERLNRLKEAREVEWADADVFLREDFEKKGEKYTENKLANLIRLDPDYRSFVEAENKAYKEYKMMRALTDAFRQRGDMLVSLGANIRFEVSTTGLDLKSLKENVNG